MARCIRLGSGADDRLLSSAFGRRQATKGDGLPHNSGYTLIELIIVMAIISVLVSIAVPIYQKSLQRTKETLLKQNLFTMRQVIDEYTFDKKKAPQQLSDLVSEGYLRAVPIDPITGTDQTWRVVMEDAVTMVDQTQPGIYNVFSGSDAKSLENTPYSSW
jgi:general secretion pathway protein G